MIENNLNEISDRLKAITPINWQTDTEMDELTMLVRHKDERKITNADMEFIEKAASDIAGLIMEVRQLREVNVALKKQILTHVEKDIRFR
jgi:tRNA isopentenyl-2-thiomethyl-A-37 hydroxylase MiaE